MRWHSPYVSVTQWHRWFAWHPVRPNNHTKAWLEVVERRYKGFRRWEYRLLKPSRVYYDRTDYGDC